MKYQDGKIYQILNSETDDVYIGSTTQKLSKRVTITKHRQKMARPNYYTKRCVRLAMISFTLN